MTVTFRVQTGAQHDVQWNVVYIIPNIASVVIYLMGLQLSVSATEFCQDTNAYDNDENK